MTHLDKGHFAKKHPSDQQLNTTIADKIKEHVSEDEITCAAAHGIAEALKISPHCQMSARAFRIYSPKTNCEAGG